MSKNIEQLEARIFRGDVIGNRDISCAKRLVDRLSYRDVTLDMMCRFLINRAIDSGVNVNAAYDTAVEQASDGEIRAAAVYAYTRRVFSREMADQFISTDDWTSTVYSSNISETEFNVSYIVEAIKDEIESRGVKI